MRAPLRIATLAVLAVSLAGCGDKANKPDGQKAPADTSAAPAQPAPVPAEDDRSLDEAMRKVAAKADETPAQAAPAETPPAELKPQGTISWRDAAKHYDKTMTVEGKIILTKNIGKITFLNFDKDFRNTFTAIIKQADYQKFPRNPEEFFKDKTVRITGTIRKFKGAPEIILTDPSQIEVVE